MNGGGGDHHSPPIPGGEYLLQLLQRPPRQHQSQTPPHVLPHDPAVAAVGPTIPHRPIQPNGHDLTPRIPLFAPHIYMQGYSQNPNSKIQSSSPPLTNSFQNLGLYQRDNSVPNCDTHNFRNSGDKINGFSDPGKTLEGNWQFNRSADNFYNSPDGSRNPREDTRLGSRRLNGYEADFRNSPNPSGNVSNRVLNGSRSTYRSFPNSSGSGEGSNSVMNGVEADYQNFPNLSRIEEGYNRQLKGFIADHRNSARSTGIGEGYSRVLNGVDSDFPHLPNYNRNQGTLSREAIARPEARQPPPGFQNKAKNSNFGHNVDKKKSSSNGSRNHGIMYKDEREKGVMPENRRNRGVSPQLAFTPPTGSAFHSVLGSEIEESLSELHNEIDENGEKSTKAGGSGTIKGYSDDWDENILGYLEEESGSSDKIQKKKSSKGYRSDTRGQMVLAQRKRMSKRMIECRRDIYMLNAPLLAIYDSLVPSEEETTKQKQLLASLKTLVINEWPDAQLLVYGSCANSFGVKKSDIDICLVMKDAYVNKSEILLRLADILKAENLENVQALTRARVPIVKLMDPVTGISCDICVNNVLAVVNSKLLRDYAKIDDRLRQLAFVVKHWAKLRGVNETYHGTLSSYAYVLMCIHYLQQCRPAILPSLQGMTTTYNVVVGNVECAFFDQVEKLSGFGSHNRESIGQLVWGFFRYWAYCHDYAHDVVSVRLGCTISKRDKGWTLRVGNDRHLICIEDPFEMSHDLGRVVDKRSIKVLREEFERAARILQEDPNPCVTLFEPYVPS